MHLSPLDSDPEIADVDSAVPIRSAAIPTPDPLSGDRAARASAAFSRKRHSFIRSGFAIAAVYLAIEVVLRVVLWWSFGRQAGVGGVALSRAVLLGLLGDLPVALFVSAPTTIVLAFIPARFAIRPLFRNLFRLFVFLILFGLIYLSAAEYFFFEEFGARFNLVAVDYLVYPHEVLINIWESYPVLPVLAAAVALAALLLRSLRHWIAVPTGSAPISQRLAVVIGPLLLAGVVAWILPSSPFARPQDRLENELSANGVLTFFEACATNDLEYTKYYKSEPRQRAFARIRESLAGAGGTFVSPEEDDLRRSFPERAAGLGRLNVVVILEESFGSEYVGACGDSRGLTPNFDGLSREGLFFSRAYATGTRTVRGLEAIVASFPPVPSESIVKREGSEGIATWGGIMRDHGYHTSFLYGGYGYFDRMNRFLASNGFEIHDRTAMQSPTFANIWGVSDEDLFREAIIYFDARAQQGAPFFSVVLTTSNHKPFSFPPGIPGIPEEGGGRKAGVRYADYALGRFFEEARKHQWFGQTVFVVVADHGTRVYGRAQIPMRHYEIPLLVLAPGRLQPRTVDSLVSQIDIAPTILAMLGLPYTAPFYGRDVLDPAGAEGVALLSHNHDVGLYRDGKFVVLGLHSKSQTYDYDEAADRQTPVADDSKLRGLATAYFQTAYDLFRSHRYR